MAGMTSYGLKVSNLAQISKLQGFILMKEMIILSSFHPPFIGVVYMPEAVKTITVEELKKLIDEGADFQLIDVREADEKAYADIGGELIPMGSILREIDRISREKQVVIYCRSGSRSGTVVAELQKRFGFGNLYNLRGGILAWSDRIDNSIRKY